VSPTIRAPLGSCSGRPQRVDDFSRAADAGGIRKADLRLRLVSEVDRIVISNGKVEQVVSLKGIHLTAVYLSWLGLTPDDSVLILKDAGTREIVSMHWTAP